MIPPKKNHLPPLFFRKSHPQRWRKALAAFKRSSRCTSCWIFSKISLAALRSAASSPQITMRRSCGEKKRRGKGPEGLGKKDDIMQFLHILVELNLKLFKLVCACRFSKWVDTWVWHMFGNQHPFTSYFRLPRASEFWIIDILAIGGYLQNLFAKHESMTYRNIEETIEE